MATPPQPAGAAPGADAPITIRAAVPADAPGIVTMREVVAGEGRWIGRELPLPPELGDAIEASIRAGDGPYLVCDQAGRIVGDAGLHPDGHGHAGLFMALLPEARGQGLGGRLLDELIAWARDQDELFKLILDVWPHNEPALRLYRSRGFQVEGYRHRHWRRQDGELWDAIEMGLLLDT
ncbi:MAG: N-acetyltransferase [Acidimicrobiales bacterium]